MLLLLGSCGYAPRTVVNNCSGPPRDLALQSAVQVSGGQTYNGLDQSSATATTTADCTDPDTGEYIAGSSRATISTFPGYDGFGAPNQGVSVQTEDNLGVQQNGSGWHLRTFGNYTNQVPPFGGYSGNSSGRRVYVLNPDGSYSLLSKGGGATLRSGNSLLRGNQFTQGVLERGQNFGAGVSARGQGFGQGVSGRAQNFGQGVSDRAQRFGAGVGERAHQFDPIFGRTPSVPQPDFGWAQQRGQKNLDWMQRRDAANQAWIQRQIEQNRISAESFR